jgi:hypothetical protein
VLRTPTSNGPLVIFVLFVADWFVLFVAICCSGDFEMGESASWLM